MRRLLIAMQCPAAGLVLMVLRHAVRALVHQEDKRSEALRSTGAEIVVGYSFVDAARFLAERSELSDRVSYQRGNALFLPFGAGVFDVAWTQHVPMNIADRDALYGETFRVLRSGGSFAIYDVVAASEGPLHYPVPWARGPETSFLVTADTTRAILIEQGFRVVSWADCTDAGAAWFAERETLRLGRQHRSRSVFMS